MQQPNETSDTGCAAQEQPSGPSSGPAGRRAGFANAARAGALSGREGLYQLLVESVRDYAIFALDPTGCVLTWTAGAERLKGYTTADIVGRHFSTFYPASDVAAGKPERELADAIRDGRVEDEGWRVRKDGTLFWANVVITALRDETGALVGFAKVTRDLTERRAAHERAVADARRVAEAEASNRAKTDFLAAMSHELRTPINAAIGYAELLEVGVAGVITPKQREYLARIRSSQTHLLRIITDLLNYSRIEAGQVTYAMASVPLHDVVESVLPMIGPQAAAKELTVAHGPCQEGTIARADRARVEQIVLNLLSNAVKFTTACGRISVRCGAHQGEMTAETAGEAVSITVADTGPGIPADKREAIFEPFVQIGRSLTSGHEGTGLGLAISRDLARAMGGDVRAGSTTGPGAAFTLTLPRHAPEGAVPAFQQRNGS